MSHDYQAGGLNVICKLYTATMSQPDSLLTRATSHSTGHTVVTLNMNTISGGLKNTVHSAARVAATNGLSSFYTVDV